MNDNPYRQRPERTPQETTTIWMGACREALAKAKEGVCRHGVRLENCNEPHEELKNA